MEFRISDDNLPTREELEKKVNRLKLYLTKLQKRITLKRDSLRKEIEKIPDNQREKIEAGLKWLKETDNPIEPRSPNPSPPEE